MSMQGGSSLLLLVLLVKRSGHAHLCATFIRPSTLPRHTTCAMPTGEGQDDRPPSDHQQLGAPSAPDEPKRRPGRPRGSKNRRPRGSDPQRPPTGQHGFYQYSVPPAPGESHPHNQQYYEFQRRVLKLCANFYGAAEELVVSCSPPHNLMPLDPHFTVYLESHAISCHCTVLSDGSECKG